MVKGGRRVKGGIYLVSDDVQGFGKVVDELVTIAKDHLLRVPIGVAIVYAKVDGPDEVETLVIDGVAVEDLAVEVKGVAEILVALTDSGILIRGGGLTLLEDKFAGKEIVVLVVVSIVHFAVEVRALGFFRSWLRLRQLLMGILPGCLLVSKSALGTLSSILVDVLGLREVAEDVVWDDASSRWGVGP